MKSFLEIDPGIFKESVLIVDVDGTIVADKHKEIGLEIIEKIKELASENKVYLCSNGSPENAKIFAQLAGISVLSGKKPFFVKVPKKEKSSEIVVIGDKYLTDGIFAKVIGGKFLKVKHILSKSDSVFIKISYFIDDVVYAVSPYLKLIRPWQWIKNLLVFAPLFFASAVFIPEKFIATLLTFFAFSAIASAVYIFNDILDKESDKLHPQKKNRPIASGKVSIPTASFLIFGLVIIGTLFLILEPSSAWIIAIYVTLNVAYSIRLKHVAVVDIVCVAVFYILRVMAGGAVAKIPLSSWIILCVFFGALFIIVGKRRAEYQNGASRKVLAEYSIEALDFMLSSSAALAIISYSTYTILAHNLPYLVYSTLFVTLALFRILNRIYTHPEQAESPEKIIFKDPWVFTSFALWLANVFFVFYM